MPTTLEEYLFDLRGYIHLQDAIDRTHVAELNASLDTYLDLEPDAWRGWVYRHPNRGNTRHLHNVFEIGEPFERLIDHPSWLTHVNRFVGGDDGLFIDESFADIRVQGEATRIHSGASKRRIRTQFRYHNGQFRCGQINILLALTNVGYGDGPTMVVPGSHKSNIAHPVFKDGADSLDKVPAAVEIPLQSGDAACFVDCIAHGSARRVNPGERRMLIIRYGPHWGNDRYGFQPSPELIARLTPERRRIVQPLQPRRPPNEHPPRE
mgnify:FL=1